VFGQGEIPKEIGNLRLLQGLFLNENQLEGKISDIISDVHKQCILIGAGQIPKEIANLKSLQSLCLCKNQLEGKIDGHHC
jgi:hypothetical protein